MGVLMDNDNVFPGLKGFLAFLLVAHLLRSRKIRFLVSGVIFSVASFLSARDTVVTATPAADATSSNVAILPSSAWMRAFLIRPAHFY